jgi:hypothetical protein
MSAQDFESCKATNEILSNPSQAIRQELTELEK